ncbi:hypothetical protein CHS0354_010175 [Potamilus streckersoni]|uniref:TIR domain-containing protein n=1 Tax=Potamilus streckersoni TaxID=2493646 RepID=A0AAE0VNH7_9BIVA|nr:hypothetical protein CHS0354_010175 [Potamilus streckersoni]
MGCSASHSSGSLIKERSISNLSTPLRHSNGDMHVGSSASNPLGDPVNSISSVPMTHSKGVMDIGCSTSLPVGSPINEGANSTPSPPPANINGHIEEERSPSPLLQQPVDVKISNVTTQPSDTQKQTENEKTSDLEKQVDDFGWLDGKEREKKELTDKEIQRRKDGLFRILNTAITNIHHLLCSENAEEKWKEVLVKQFFFISNFVGFIRRIGPLPVDVVNKYSNEAGQKLSLTKSVCLVCKVVTTGWQKCAKRQGDKAIEQPSEVTLAAFSILWNFSDCSPEVTYNIVEDSCFLNTVREILTSYQVERINGAEMSEAESKMVGASLSIIHNLSKVDENVTPLRDKDFVAIVSPYLDSKTEQDRFKTLASLANLIDEKESEILQGKDDLLKMFLETLQKALQTIDHTCLVNSETWSAWESTLTIHRLARNHANKTLLVQMGCLRPLVELAQIGTVEETREAVGAIWFLAFDKGNQTKILEDKELNIVEMLIRLKEKWEDKTIQEAADGTMWLLRGQLQNNDKYKGKVKLYSNWDKVRAAVKQQSKLGVIGTKSKKGHIMISYNWSHQHVLIQIRDELKANGYSVWMDIDNMGGSTLQAMAEAVEMAHVVLICMSQKYKNSNNCKKEAEYAYQLQKKVVPLKMENDYKPNGWLGFIVGAELFYDFSGKYDFKVKFKELLKRIAVLFCEEGSETNYVTIIKETGSIRTLDRKRPCSPG